MSAKLFTNAAACKIMQQRHPNFDREQARNDRGCGGYAPADCGTRLLFSRDDLVALDYQLTIQAEGAKVRIGGIVARWLRDAMDVHPNADRVSLVTLVNGNRFAAPSDALDLSSGSHSGGAVREALTIDARNLRARVDQMIEEVAQIVGDDDAD